MAFFALPRKVRDVRKLMEPYREEVRPPPRAGQELLVPLREPRLSEELHLGKDSSEERFELRDRVLSDVIRVPGAIEERESRAQEVAVWSGTEKPAAGRENPAGLAEERDVVLDVLEGLEADVEIEGAFPGRKSGRVGANEAQARRVDGNVHRGDLTGSRLRQNSRAVTGAASRVEDPEPGSSGRGPAISGEMLVPEPGRRETIERETFHRGGRIEESPPG
jgi:hypothetical protein